MDGEDPFDAFSIADAANCKHLVEPMAAAADDNPRKNLDSLLIAFHDFGVDAHSITYAKIGSLLAEVFRFNFIEQCLIHKKFGFGLSHRRTIGQPDVTSSSNPFHRSYPLSQQVWPPRDVEGYN